LSPIQREHPHGINERQKHKLVEVLRIEHAPTNPATQAHEHWVVGGLLLIRKPHQLLQILAPQLEA